MSLDVEMEVERRGTGRWGNEIDRSTGRREGNMSEWTATYGCTCRQENPVCAVTQSSVGPRSKCGGGQQNN